MTALQTIAPNANEALSLTVNGEPRTIAAGSTLADLLNTLNLDVRTVVVEHNRDIIRQDLADHALSSGDVIEIVHFVGGG